jgi:hypothetical protein
MSTTPAALLTAVVLSLAGLLPALALVGPRLLVVPLLPLTGAVIAALSATAYVAVGGSFIGWFIGLALAGALAVAVIWWRWPDHRPWRGQRPLQVLRHGWPRLTGIAGVLALLGACAWNLRGLATATVGFDARALWLMRAGWFLQSHQQLLIKMRVPDVILTQSAYPPLVSATTALAWRITGDQSVRLGVVIIAVLNTCALVSAAAAFIAAGRRAAVVGATSDGHDGGVSSPPDTPVSTVKGRTLLAPLLVGPVAACLLIFVAFGITEPFMTNGYADPIWSLAAVGAVAYGLQLEMSASHRGMALILLLVAGMSKDEGVVTAGLLIGLITVRGILTLSSPERRRWWWRPLLLGCVEVALIALWPLLMRVIHARGDSAPVSPAHDYVSRARAAYDGMVPYLHVIVLAAPLAVVGALVLSGVRRRSGAGNELWGWAALAAGLVAILGAFATGTGAIGPWLTSTVHRVTEFSALTGWWIVAMWAVVASASFAGTSRRRHHGNHRASGAPWPGHLEPDRPLTSVTAAAE